MYTGIKRVELQTVLILHDMSGMLLDIAGLVPHDVDLSLIPPPPLYTHAHLYPHPRPPPNTDTLLHTRLLNSSF
jgi:hypothetical protein